MNRIIKTLFTGYLLLCGIITNYQAYAAIKLPALIGNNMVLQQNSTIKVWGWADAGEKVTVKTSWIATVSSALTTAHGNWETTIKTPGAGGPYTITISGRDYSIAIDNVMIGEVWICSGQSNMEFTMRGLGGWRNYKPEIRQEVAKGKYSDVRLFTVGRDTSAISLANCSGNWQISDTTTVNDFSATAWFYGSYLSKELNTPVGLIVSAWGGTPAEVWTPVESIIAEPDLGSYLKHWNGSQWWPGTPGVLYNAMIYPLLNYTIKGAIWYQGESNRLDARLYPKLMNTLITGWRKAWNVGEFPFYFVQIAPFAYEEPFAGALLREAQSKCLSTKNTGMIVTLDIAGNINDIHPKNKLDVGKRLALLALNKTYGKTEVGCSGPVHTDAQASADKIVLNFDNTESGLRLLQPAKNNFIIAGTDHVFFPATVRIQGNSLVLSSPKVKQPKAVRYAFTNTSEATFFNGLGLPASSFRTDNWDIITEKAVLEPFMDPDTKALTYKLTSSARESDIYYDFNRVPDKNSKIFQMSIPSGKPGILYATVSRNGFLAETTSRWKIVANKAKGAEIIYKNPYSDRFSAGGKLALVDGILATLNFQDGSWQGFEGNNLDVVIDFGKSEEIKNVKANFLSDNKSWIFLPKKVTVQVSDDGLNYKDIGEWNFDADKEIKDAVIQPIKFQIKGKWRYIKLVAINQETCPAWHPGAGNKCWLMIDELAVESPNPSL